MRSIVYGAHRSARSLLLLAGLLLAARVQPLLSHPGIGIVIDTRGNIYYTDLKHVWKLTPDRKKSIAVSNVHTHELYIDVDNNLYGEHLWYEGEASDTWGHRVWRLTPEGRLTDVIPARRGFREDYGDFFFDRDRVGNMYWADQRDSTRIKKRSRNGTTSIIATASFRDVRQMTVTPEGTVYLVDLYDLVRVSPDGAIQPIAKDLADWSLSRLVGPDRHAIMGLWMDAQENVYAAVPADREVKKVNPHGDVQVIAHSDSSWAPTGGLVTAAGDLWVLECSVTNSVRVCRIETSGRRTIFE